jgi:hypothetical protein
MRLFVKSCGFKTDKFFNQRTFHLLPMIAIGKSPDFISIVIGLWFWKCTIIKHRKRKS